MISKIQNPNSNPKISPISKAESLKKHYCIYIDGNYLLTWDDQGVYFTKGKLAERDTSMAGSNYLEHRNQ